MSVASPDYNQGHCSLVYHKSLPLLTMDWNLRNGYNSSFRAGFEDDARIVLQEEYTTPAEEGKNFLVLSLEDDHVLKLEGDWNDASASSLLGRLSG